MGVETVVFSDPKVEFQVEVAETEDQREQGLMYRKTMASNAGMLFVFEQQDIQRVWMKNTLISLDIVFLSTQGEIVSILQHIKPCEQVNCPVYESKKPAKYMLEVNAGMVKIAGLELGQTFSFLQR